MRSGSRVGTEVPGLIERLLDETESPAAYTRSAGALHAGTGVRVRSFNYNGKITGTSSTVMSNTRTVKGTPIFRKSLNL